MFALKPPLEVPRRLRAIVRARESSLILLAAIVGACAGLVVAVMGTGVDILHRLFFGLQPGQRLSGLITLDPRVAFAVPFLGGIAFGLLTALVARWRPRREVDPIEANALRGGRMSLIGSLIVATETVWSSGVGASVGLEAGYTQLASGIASRIGRAFRLRRGDLRVLVGCGAAAGIAGAFAAPLAGAFYGFELVIGTYSTASLMPVGIASLVGYFVAKALAPVELGIVAAQTATVAAHDLVGAGALGLLAALIGIAVMRGVALCETTFTLLRVRPALRPALGGLVVGLLATVSPQVMSSGHGALHLAGMLDLPLRLVALIFALKILASIVSLGSGFRGGLFFASLLTGALGGQLFATALDSGWPGYYFNPDAYAVIGMSALSASVIGGPLTMTFIALETTGDLWLTTAVLVAVIVAAQVTREAFGYSFATWRFHLRGESIRSAADIGWMRDLTVWTDDAARRADGRCRHGDRGLSRKAPLGLRLAGRGGRPGPALCRPRQYRGGACRGAVRAEDGQGHRASCRGHAVAEHDRQGSGGRVRPRRSRGARGGQLLRRASGDGSAHRSLCVAPLFGGARVAPARGSRGRLEPISF